MQVSLNQTLRDGVVALTAYTSYFKIMMPTEHKEIAFTVKFKLTNLAEFITLALNKV